MFNLTRFARRLATSEKPVREAATNKPKSPEVKSNPIFPTRLHSLFYKRPVGLDLAREIQLYLNSNAYRQRFKTKLVLFRYNSYCLHHWLLINRLRQETSFKSWRISKSLGNLLEDYTRDHVYEYQNAYFNVKIYHELTRIQKAIFWSLDDYFYYNFRGKALRQIVEEDILVDDLADLDLENYINTRILYLRELSFTQITDCEVDWGQNSS